MDTEQLHCKECNKTFSHQGNLRRHRHAIHSLTVMKYICWYCNKSYKRQENARKHIASTHTGLEERITTKHFPNTKNKNTDNNIETFKPKPWTPPPEALTKTQYRIYVRSAQPKIYRALTIKQALTAVQGYSREADLLYRRPIHTTRKLPSLQYHRRHGRTRPQQPRPTNTSCTSLWNI